MTALLAVAMGCDMINVAREAMMAIGCIQAQRCHTGNCPTGVATQRKRLERGLVVSDKAPRTTRYLATLRQELVRLARACGEPHPAWVGADQIEVLEDPRSTVGLGELAQYRDASWGRPEAGQRRALAEMWAPMADHALDTAEDPSAAAGRSGDPRRRR